MVRVIEVRNIEPVFVSTWSAWTRFRRPTISCVNRVIWNGWDFDIPVGRQSVLDLILTNLSRRQCWIAPVHRAVCVLPLALFSAKKRFYWTLGGMSFERHDWRREINVYLSFGSQWAQYHKFTARMYQWLFGRVSWLSYSESSPPISSQILLWEYFTTTVLFLYLTSSWAIMWPDSAKTLGIF